MPRGDETALWRYSDAAHKQLTASEDVAARPALQFMMNKRIVVKLVPQRIRSWDHRKLGMEPMAVAGSTAPFIGTQ